MSTIEIILCIIIGIIALYIILSWVLLPLVVQSIYHTLQRIEDLQEKQVKLLSALLREMQEYQKTEE